MTYYEDIRRQKAEIGNYKPFFSFKNILIACLVAEDKRSGFDKQIEKAKQDSIKTQTAKHESAIN